MLSTAGLCVSEGSVNVGGVSISRRPDRVLVTPARALIAPLSMQEARPMSDRIVPPDDIRERGPWPPVDDSSRLFDHGWPWCVNAAGHPDPEGGYPAPVRHLPAHECQSRAAFLDGVRRDLDGQQLGVSVYNAASIRFGEPRDDSPPASPRVVLDTWAMEEKQAQRISLTPGAALQLARILVRFADELTFPKRAA